MHISGIMPLSPEADTRTLPLGGGSRKGLGKIPSTKKKQGINFVPCFSADSWRQPPSPFYEGNRTCLSHAKIRTVQNWGHIGGGLLIGGGGAV